MLVGPISKKKKLYLEVSTWDKTNYCYIYQHNRVSKLKTPMLLVIKR